MPDPVPCLCFVLLSLLIPCSGPVKLMGPISCQAKLYVILDLKISTEVLNFDMIHSIYQIKVVLAVVCSIPRSKITFGYPFFSKLASGRYPENYYTHF